LSAGEPDSKGNDNALLHHEIFEELGIMLVKREKWEKALDCLDRINQCEQVGRLSLSTKPQASLARAGR
jgi:hypothetical protein